MRLLKLLVAFALCMSLAVVVSAHSGRTDSNGGHYDRSTGDYHYHHGYSAHDHYDMDGDGDVDCPYEYEYNYDPSPGSSDSYFDIITIPSWDEIVEAHEEMYGQTEPPTEEPEEESDSKDKRNNKIKEYLIPIGGCIALYALIWIVDEIKWRRKR